MWWAREELNLRPLPCQLTRAYRCANRRFPSSRSTADGKVKCCLGEGDMHAPSGGEVIRTHRAGFTALALLLTPLGLLPTFTCTDSYCAQPTPYHEPCAAPPRRPAREGCSHTQRVVSCRSSKRATPQLAAAPAGS